MPLFANPFAIGGIGLVAGVIIGSIVGFVGGDRWQEVETLRSEKARIEEEFARKELDLSAARAERDNERENVRRANQLAAARSKDAIALEREIEEAEARTADLLKEWTDENQRRIDEAMPQAREETRTDGTRVVHVPVACPAISDAQWMRLIREIPIGRGRASLPPGRPDPGTGQPGGDALP